MHIYTFGNYILTITFIENKNFYSKCKMHNKVAKSVISVIKVLQNANKSLANDNKCKQ